MGANSNDDVVYQGFIKSAFRRKRFIFSVIFSAARRAS